MGDAAASETGQGGGSALPEWLLRAREQYVPHIYPAPGPVQVGDIRPVDPHGDDPDALRQLVLVTGIVDDSPWTRERPVAQTLLVSADVDLAYDDDYRVLGETPWPMIVIAQAVGSVWVDRLGECVHQCPEMIAPLREIMRRGPMGFSGPLTPAGLPIVSSQDPRLPLRNRMHAAYQGALDSGDIVHAAEEYLQADPGYDGPGVL